MTPPRRGKEVTHIKIQNTGDFYDLYGGEKFATLGELVAYYIENPGTLRERNGQLIDLIAPLNCEEVTTERCVSLIWQPAREAMQLLASPSLVSLCRWFHSGLTGREAETLLLAKGQDGSYLVRSSVHNPGNYVLSARVDERVSHVIIRHRDGVFDVGGGPTFHSLVDLMEHYKKNPMVETSGTVIHLKHPYHATSFLPSNITQRVTELQKQNQDVYGKAGFWEEFEVRIHSHLCRTPVATLVV